MLRNFTLNHIRQAIVKIRKWLLTNKWGKVLLLTISPFYLLPQHFENHTGKSKPIIVRFAGVFGPPLTAALFFGWVLSKFAKNMITHTTPSIQGVTGQGYVKIIENISFQSFVEGAVLAFVTIYIIGGGRWMLHRVTSAIVVRSGFESRQACLSYFLFLSSSGAVWLGLMAVAAGAFGPSLMEANTDLIFKFFNANPELSIFTMFVFGALMERRQKIKSTGFKYLYPNWGVRITINVVVITILIVIMLGIPHLLTAGQT